MYMKDRIKLVEIMKNKFNNIIPSKKNKEKIMEKSSVSEEKSILSETFEIISNNLYYYNYETISFAIKLIENDINNRKDNNFITIAIDAVHGSGKTFVANFIYFVYNISYLLYNPVIKNEFINILNNFKEIKENELNDEINKTIIHLEEIRDNKLEQDNKLEEIDKFKMLKDVNEIISEFNGFKETEIDQSKKQQLDQFIDTKVKEFKKPKREGVDRLNSDFKKLLSKLESVERIAHFYENKGEHLCIYISIDEQDYDDTLAGVLNIIYNSVAMQFKNGILEFDANNEELLQIIKEGFCEIAKGVLKDSGHNMVAVSKAINLIKDLKEYTEIPLEEYPKEIKDFNTNLKKFKEILIKNKVFFIVDNLDKCNPAFLVSFVDKIKYLFIDANIPFIFMIDNEYFKDLSEGKYGMNTNLSYYYNSIFHNVHKMYLKPKDKFIDDILKIDEELESYKKFYDTYKKYIKKVHKDYEMSLYEIEILIRRFNLFLEKNPFMTKNIIVDAIGYIPFFIYSLLALQIIDIHSFNTILYYNHDISKRLVNSLGKIIACYDKAMEEFACELWKKIISFRTLYVVDDIDYKHPLLSSFSYERTCDGKKLKISNNNIRIAEVSLDKFSISDLFNYEDLESNIDELLNMSVADYLRFKISQI